MARPNFHADELRAIANLIEAMEAFYQKTMNPESTVEVWWEKPGFKDIELPIINSSGDHVGDITYLDTGNVGFQTRKI